MSEQEEQRKKIISETLDLVVDILVDKYHIDESKIDKTQLL